LPPSTVPVTAMKTETDPESFERITVSLAQQLRSHDALSSIWTAQDLSALFLHQLQTRLMDEALDTKLYQVVAEANALDKTIQQILMDPHSTATLLMAIKNYARWLGRPGGSQYPPECASALYYCAIATAWLHAGVRITSLSPDGVRDGLAWTTRQEWVPDTIKALLNAAIAKEMN
jgi:hypothetical protein